MATTTRLMTAEELWALPDDERRYDLIQGVLHEMSPADAEHGELGMEFGWRVGRHVSEHGLGKTYNSETGFILARNPDTVLAPDVAFVRGDRLPTPRSARRKFLPLAPDLVVEVVSPSNSATDIEDKVQDYLDGGFGSWCSSTRFLASSSCTGLVKRPKGFRKVTNSTSETSCPVSGSPWRISSASNPTRLPAGHCRRASPYADASASISIATTAKLSSRIPTSSSTCSRVMVNGGA